MKPSTTRLVRILNRLAQNFTSAPTPSPRKQRLGSHEYQTLEARRLLAVITVNTLADSIADNIAPQLDGLVSLREAITAANNNAAFGDAPAGDGATDYIRFAPELAGQTLTLDGAELLITGSVVIRGGAGVTIDADNQSRVFSVDTDQRVAFVNLTLTGGEAREGGAVLTRGGGRVQFFGSTITGNLATAAFSGGGGIFNLDSQVVLANSEVSDNFSYGLGGGVFSADGVVNLYNSDLTSNTAFTGGAVAIAEGALYSSGSEISSNEVVYDPDAVGRDSDSTNLLGNVILQGITFEPGVGNMEGGGIALVGKDAISVINSTTVSQNVAVLGAVGGGISIRSGNRVYLARGTEVSLNQITGSGEFTFGGGIYNGGLLRATDVTFSGNSATSEDQGGSGGAIYNSGGVLTLQRSTFTDNSAENGGGAIVANSTRLRVTASTFSGNVSLTSPFPHRKSEGGAILFVGSSNGSIDGSVFEDNVGSDHGGAIAVGSSAVLEVSNSQFLSNTSRSVDSQARGFGGGGAIFNGGGTLRVFSSTFISNIAQDFFGFGVRFAVNISARGFGGAIYSVSADTTVSRSSFYSNVSEGSGGGIAILGGAASIFESTFGDEIGRGNLARQRNLFPEAGNNRGGAIFVASSGDSVGTVFIRGSLFAGNIARSSGGGIWAGQDSEVRIFASPSQQTRFVGNQALAFDGGGVYLSGNSDMRIVDAIFEENSARDGGGIYSDGGQLTLVRSEITSNEARRNGGDFYDDSDFFANFRSTIDDVFEA